MVPSGESEAEGSSCSRASTLSTLGDVPVAFLITSITVLSQRTHYIAQFLPNLLQCLLGNQQLTQAFPDTISRGLPLPPLSAKKKMAEVTAYNGQACVTDQMTPTPRPENKGTFVFCILGRAPWVLGEVSANFFPNLSQGSGLGPSSSCVNPRPDKSQYEKNGEFPERTIV